MPLTKWLAALTQRRHKIGDSDSGAQPGTAPPGGPFGDLAVASAQPHSSYRVTELVPLPREFGHHRTGGVRHSPVYDFGDAAFGIGFVFLLVVALLPFVPDRVAEALQDKVGIQVHRPVQPEARFLSLGASMDEVIRVQGQPTTVRGDTWFYGRSQVHFKNGRVAGWRSSSDQPLRTLFPMM